MNNHLYFVRIRDKLFISQLKNKFMHVAGIESVEEALVNELQPVPGKKGSRPSCEHKILIVISQDYSTGEIDKLLDAALILGVIYSYEKFEVKRIE